MVTFSTPRPWTPSTQSTMRSWGALPALTAATTSAMARTGVFTPVLECTQVSPTTRVRSQLEKQKEERVQQRAERAERRARRSAGSDVVDGEAEGQDAGADADASFASLEMELEEPPARHRRGPGDEEDYETPPRPERPAKRGRFDEGVEGEKERGVDVPEKRVKWDRGLHTTVYLDDAPPNPKWDTNAVPSQKSCLAAAAKVSVLVLVVLFVI